MFEMTFEKCGHTCVPTLQHGKKVCRVCLNDARKRYYHEHEEQERVNRSKRVAKKVKKETGLDAEIRRKIEDRKLLKDLDL